MTRAYSFLVVAMDLWAMAPSFAYAERGEGPVAGHGSISQPGRRDAAAIVTSEYEHNMNQPTLAATMTTRSQVTAEAIESCRIGLQVNGDIGNLTPTEGEAARIRLAGLQATGALRFVASAAPAAAVALDQRRPNAPTTS